MHNEKVIEKNLWAKKFIKNIIYSKSDIQINLYYSTDFGVFKNSVLPYGVGMGGDTKPQKEQRTSALNHESPQFELCKMAPGEGFEPPTKWLQVLLMFP